MKHGSKLINKLSKRIKKFVTQASANITLFRFSFDKEQFFFHNRSKLIDMLKGTMKIDDLIILVFAFIGLSLAIYEVIL